MDCKKCGWNCSPQNHLDEPTTVDELVFTKRGELDNGK